jgi:hypothetical protein
MGANFSSVVSQPGQRRRAIENNNKECKPMRSICIAISLVALLSSFGPSRAAIMQPWCWDGTSNASGELECAFKSYQQCMANKPGVGGCLANREINPLPQVQGGYTSHPARAQ